jgi:hypothetical protein
MWVYIQNIYEHDSRQNYGHPTCPALGAAVMRRRLQPAHVVCVGGSTQDGTPADAKSFLIDANDSRMWGLYLARLQFGRARRIMTCATPTRLVIRTDGKHLNATT